MVGDGGIGRGRRHKRGLIAGQYNIVKTKENMPVDFPP